MAEQLGERSSGEFPVNGSHDDPIDCYFLGKPAVIARGCHGCPALSQVELNKSLFIGSAGVQLDINDLARMGKHEVGDRADEAVTRRLKPAPAMSRTFQEKLTEEHQRRANGGLDGTCEFIDSIDSCWYRVVVNRALDNRGEL